MPAVVSTLICMLLTLTLMWPSEGAGQGEGLHLILLWGLTGIVAVLMGRGSVAVANHSGGRRLTTALPVILLVAGFWLSTWRVFDIEGDRRTAVNLTLEWTGIGIAWWLISGMASRQEFRQLLLRLLIGLGTGAALLGLAQHHVTYERQAAWYLGKRATLDETIDGGDLPAMREKSVVLSEFQAMGIPLDGGERELFERRLLDSSEPVGPFALANSLGGLLAVVTVLLMGCVAHRIRSSSSLPPGVLCRIIPLFLIVGYCLLLTKSRTAWISTGIGLTLLLLIDLPSAAKLKRVVAAGTVLTALLISVGIGTGAIDKEIVLESPRSLQFRLLYWMGAVGVIREDPVFGAGPGNFRQVYLKHKPVESSEEIQDPHNILLDAWCSAGLFGITGITLLGLSIVWGLSRRRHLESSSAHAGPDNRTPTLQWQRTIIRGIAAASLVHLTWRWLEGGQFWDTTAQSFWESNNLVLAVPIGALITRWLLPAELSIPRSATMAAAAVLLIHLMGAGGLQITGIGLILLTLHALAVVDTTSPTKTRPGSVPGMLVLPMRIAAATILCVFCWGAFRYGLIPVRNATSCLAASRIHAGRGDTDRARKVILAGIAADPLSTGLRQRNCELSTYEFANLTDAGARPITEPKAEWTQCYETAMKACEELITADKRSIGGYLQRSDLNARAAKSGLGDDLLDAAIADLRQVTKMYPTNAHHWARLAVLHNKANQPAEAGSAADKAIQIDQSNRTWNHADRYLADETIEKLTRLTVHVRSNDDNAQPLPTATAK